MPNLTITHYEFSLPGSFRTFIKKVLPGFKIKDFNHNNYKLFSSYGALVIQGHINPNSTIDLGEIIKKSDLPDSAKKALTQKKISDYNHQRWRFYAIVIKSDTSSNLKNCVFIRPSHHKNRVILVKTNYTMLKLPKGLGILLGGPKKDTLHGSGKYSFIFGGDEDDTIFGTKMGVNKIFGNNGNDTISGGNDSNELYGGDGNDTISGGSKNNFIFGENGDDIIYSKGNSYLYGGKGDDTLHGGNGKDTFKGGDGNNKYFLNNNSTLDTLNLSPSAGTDTFDITDLNNEIHFFVQWDEQKKSANLFLIDSKNSYTGKVIAVTNFTHSRDLVIRTTTLKKEVYTIQYHVTQDDYIRQFKTLLLDGIKKICLPEGCTLINLVGPDGRAVKGISQQPITDKTGNIMKALLAP